MTSPSAVLLTRLTKQYGERAALSDIELTVPLRSRTVVLGHNGAGKSTLLEIIATLRTPTSGTVHIAGLDARTHLREVRRLIGLTPQANALDPLSTPLEALRFHGAVLGLGRRETTRRADELLQLLGLAENGTTRISTLSGGTRRKVDLALTLLAEPRIVILDEPTTGLDPVSRLDFWAELTRLSDAGHTLIISTQDLDEADVLATGIVVLREGRIVAHDSPAALKHRVGERTLTLEFAAPAEAQRLLSSLSTPFIADPTDERRVRLALTTGADAAAGMPALNTALTELAGFAGSPTALSMSEPSLDDVFLALAAR
ncbi:ABC transporter ATP-binding protein [Microbacterium jiangjiandongii]|uniref:ABC transporter ATP-binding protein n=1 Tax=Microbacterium jiangjiandongii TaxID=3049071 RepID=UPI00214CB5CA|nr:ABC transporter ATP-binding protein [Microbacterium sp. zg.Y843]MCR2816623.1 ABC transporter ATP-binding protein [Microbacterium sp. zg.Y843]